MITSLWTTRCSIKNKLNPYFDYRMLEHMPHVKDANSIHNLSAYAIQSTLLFQLSTCMLDYRDVGMPIWLGWNREGTMLFLSEHLIDWSFETQKTSWPFVGRNTGTFIMFLKCQNAKRIYICLTPPRGKCQTQLTERVHTSLELAIRVLDQGLYTTIEQDHARANKHDNSSTLGLYIRRMLHELLLVLAD